MPTEMNEEFLQQYGNRIRKLGYLLDTSEASVEVRRRLQNRSGRSRQLRDGLSETV